MSEQELNQDELEQEFDQIDEELEEQSEGQEEESNTPEGFLSFDEYVAAGNDPDMYRGKKAFEQFYDKNQEVKQTKAELREIKESVEAMAKAIKAQSMAEAEAKIAAAEARMAQAKEEADVDEYAKAASEAQELKQKIEQQQINQEQKITEPVFIQQFRQSNPVLDLNNVESFDPDVNMLVEAKYNAQIQRLAPEFRTEAEAQKILANAFKEVTGKFASQKAQKTPKTPIKTRQVEKNNVKTKGARLSALSDSERSVYDVVLQTSGEEAAKQFLNNLKK